MGQINKCRISCINITSNIAQGLKDSIDKAHETFLSLNDKSTDGTLLKISFDLNKLKFAPKLVADSVSKSAVALMDLLNRKGPNPNIKQAQPKVFSQQAQLS